MASYLPTRQEYSRGVALVLLAGVLWSIAGLVIRFIDHATEWQILFYRSLALTFTLFYWIGLRYRGPLIRAYTECGTGGILGGACLALAFASWIFAMTHTTIANALFILASAPFITAILGRVILAERVRRLTLVCALVTLAGISIMVAEGFITGTLLGSIYALGAATGFSFFTIFLRRTHTVDMTPAVFWAGIWGSLIGAVMIWINQTGFQISRHDFEMCVLLGFVQVGLGMIIFTMGSRFVPAAELALLSMTEVVLGPVWVWLVIGEVPGTFTLIGGTIVLGAITYQAMAGIHTQSAKQSVPVGA